MSATVSKSPSATGRSSADTRDVVAGVRLHRLNPRGDVYPVPVVLVPSLLSKWYVFDLHPGRSFAAFLRDHNYDVWVVDWEKPARHRPTPGFSSYVDDYLAAVVDDVTGAVGVDHVTMLGYSLGGVLASVFTALYPDRVRNLITLTTPIDFHRTGMTATWARYFPVDPFVDFWGNIPGWWFRAAFTTLAVPRLAILWRIFASDMTTAEGREIVRAVRRWIGDGVPVAGELYRRLVRDCYKHNLLIRGGLVVGGRTVDLGAIDAALLTITAAEDHLCPPKAAEALNRSVASEDETAITVPGGHLGAVIGPRANHMLWTRIVDWLDSRSGHHPAEWYGETPS